MTPRAVWVAAACASALSVTLAAQTPSTPEEFAERQYQSGLEFLASGRYSEALKDFQAVVEGYPSTTVADDAELAIARYQLEIANDPAAAQAAAETVLKRFPASDAIPMAYVVAGQAIVAQGMTPANVEAALASFERVPRLFPGADATGPAGYAAGDTLKRLGRCGEALDRFTQVTLEFPETEWASRSLLASAGCLVEAGRPADAMAKLQRVVDIAPDGRDAARARDLNRILYRLYVRAPAQPAYVYADKTIAGPGGKLRDVGTIALSTAADGALQVFVTGRNGVTVFDERGTAVRSFGSGEPRAMALDRRGKIVLAQKAMLQEEAGSSASGLVTLTAPRDASQQQKVLDDLSAVAVLSSGDRLVADRSARIVARFDASGKYIATVVAARATRLALGPAEQLAVLDRDAKTVSIVDRTGKPLARILAKGTGYTLNNPEDIAFDALGHLYVLDRASVAVFKADGSLVTVFTSPATGGMFHEATAFAVDRAARLYIYDDRASRIQVYQ